MGGNHLVKVETGETLGYADDDVLVDCGDVTVFPLDPLRTVGSVSAATRHVVEKGAFPLILGGDHFITYASVKGVVEGLRKRNPQAQLGYLHIDAHLDAATDSPIYGKYYHGTNTRLISQLEGVVGNNMVMVGTSWITRSDGWKLMKQIGARIFTLGAVKREGIARVMRDALACASRDTDAVYVSCDVDVLDPSTAPGTGATALAGGLTREELFGAAEILASASNIAGLDFVEVAPNWDPTARTQGIAARFLFTVLTPRLFTGEAQAP